MRTAPIPSALAALAFLACAAAAHAQDKATELTAGVVGVSSTHVDGDDASLLRVATGAFVSAGFYLSPGFAIEPGFALNLASYDGESESILTLGVAAPIYFRKGWGRAGPYLAPRFTWNQYDASYYDAVSQVALGVALGTKVPLNDNAALRLQGSFDYGFENENFLSTTSFGASLGLSVFIH